MRAFIFPGQGSQAVGMGKALAEAFMPAREVFREVDEALSQHLARLMWEGPESDLILTENAQPAIMAAGMAVVRVLQREAGLDFARHARLVAGHSLGEYTALCAAGSFTLADTARLLKTRGRAMQDAVPVGVGAMIALIGADVALAEEAAKEAVAQAIEADPVCDGGQRQCAGSGGDFRNSRRRSTARAKSPRRKASSALCRSRSARRSIVR